jgi:hypothetical protein
LANERQKSRGVPTGGFLSRKVQIGPSVMYSSVANFSLKSAFAMRN